MIDLDHRKPFTFDRVIRIALVVVGIIGAVMLLRKLSGPLIPFAIAVLLAYLLNPLVGFFIRTLKLKSRLPAIMLSLLSITAVFALASWLIVPAIAKESREMSELLTTVINEETTGNGAVSKGSGLIPASWITAFQELIAREDVRQMIDPANLSKVAEYALAEAWGVISYSYKTILGFFGLFVILLYLIFILLDYEILKKGWKNYLPPSQVPIVEGVARDLERSMSVYFRAQGLIAFINGVLFAIGFYLIGLPLGILLGLFTGLLNMVPYLQLVALLPATVLGLMKALETGQEFWIIFTLILVVFLVVSLIEQVILTPRIMGEATGMNPAIIMLALSIWGSLLGMLGLIIALPLTSLMSSWYRQYLINQYGEEAEVQTIKTE